MNTSAFSPAAVRVYTDPDAEDVVGQPRPLVYYVLHANADRSQYPAQLGDPSRPVAQRRVELHQPAVDGQTSVQTPAQYRRVYVAAAEQQNDPVAGTAQPRLSKRQMSV